MPSLTEAALADRQTNSSSTLYQVNASNKPRRSSN